MKTYFENCCENVCDGITFEYNNKKNFYILQQFTFYNFLHSVDENFWYALVCSKK